MTWCSTQTGTFMGLLFLTACAASPVPQDVSQMTLNYEPGLQTVTPDRSAASAGDALATNRMAPSKAALGATDWKFIFNQLFVTNIWKTVDATKVNSVLEHSIYYSPDDFNTVYKNILTSKSSEGAFRARNKSLDFSEIKLSELKKFPPAGLQMSSEAQAYFTKVINSKGERFGDQQNYFGTTMGKEIDAIFHDAVLVVIPGFGSHTIKDYTWPEIVSAANVRYGRAIARPDADAAPYMKFYNTNNPDIGFDVVHPMGNELGFSMGRDKDSGDKLALWLMTLKKIPAYSRKKWILLGYSKGAPIAQNMVASHPEIRKDVLAIVTMAGVNQGALPAESALNTVRSVFKVDELDPFFKSLTPDKAKSLVEQTMGGILGFNVNLGSTLGAVAAGLSDAIGSQFPALAADAYYKVLFGVEDMSVFQRAEWNLENMNDTKFSHPISIFNLSAIANIADFMLPNGFTDGGNSVPPSPLVMPQFSPSLQIQNQSFSRDDAFLYLTSLTGFRQSAGGLFDTQVAWLDTKSMALDQRPLSASLDAAALKRLQAHVQAAGIQLPNDFGDTPRAQLLSQLYAGHMNNMSFVDLGEVRGTHWDLAFQQVYKPKDTDQYYTHTFPRRAFQASILETLALYRLMGGM